MAEVKMLAPNETVWWVPAAGVSDYAAPTSAEINAGSNISCAIVTGYSLNSTDPDTDDTKSICANSNAKNTTFDNYEGDLTFFRSDLAVTTAVYATAFTLFSQPDIAGYLVRRIGKGFTAAAASGDVVSVFGFTTDNPIDVEPDAGGPIQFRQVFIPTGEMKVNYTLAA